MHVHFGILALAFCQTLRRMPFSPRRLLVLSLFLLVFLPFECFTWLCLKLDELVYPRFRSTRVETPVFIVGNPRSGTSFFHRLMAMDDHLFTHVRLHEILFPSIVQQKVLAGLGKLDRALGSPFRRAIRLVENHATRESDKVRRIHLEEPEEDEMVLVHAFATSTLLMLFPGAEVLAPLVQYDELDEERRRPIDAFYTDFVRRHIHRDGGARRFLSKNTTFPTKVRTIHRLFPSAQFIYLVRNPAVSIASTADMFDRFWQTQFDRKGLEAQRRRLVETACYLYRHALEALDDLPAGSSCVVRYEDLVADPEATVKRAYQALGLPLSPMFEERLSAAAREGRAFKSRHHYTLDAIGLSEEDLEAALPEVYARFAFREHLGEREAGDPGKGGDASR